MVEAPVLAPGEVFIDEAQQAAMNAELEEAAKMALPDDGDDF